MATYQAPGVTIQETTQSSNAPLIATPDDICLIGYVPQYESVSLRPFTLSGLDRVDLNVPADAATSSFSILSVFATNPLDGGTGYSTTNGYANTRYDIVTGDTDWTGTITTVAGSTSATITATTLGNIAVGMKLAGTIVASKVTDGTTITAIATDGVTLTLSTPALANGTSTAATGSTNSVTKYIRREKTEVGNLKTSFNATATSVVITLATGAKIPSSGVILIDDEPITYSAATVTSGPGDSTLTCTRNNAVAVYHSATATATDKKVYRPGDSNSPYSDAYSAIPNGISLNVIWQYTPADHFTAKLYTSTSDIINKFGKPFTDPDQKTINQPVSLAGSLAFLNGATRVWIQPLFKLNGTTPTHPTLADTADSDLTWNPTLKALQNIENLGVIVPVIGQNSIVTDQTQLNIIRECQKYIIAERQQNQNYVILIAGENGWYSSDIGKADTLRSHSVSIDNDQQVVLITPTKFKTPSPKGENVEIGGQFAAAAVAGRLVSQAPSKTLTRKSIIGLNYVDPRTKDNKNLDAQAGLFVIENTGNNIQVRHALTTNTETVAKSELSVVRAKQRMVLSVMQTIDQNIIGQVVADNNAPLVIESAIRSVLQTLVDDRDIVAYSDVVATVKNVNPTVIDVTFSYRPAFPVNYVNVSFAVDLTSGSLTLTNTNNSGVA
jgi:hypothetical protein